MSPLRIIVIGVLLYIAFRVIFRGRKNDESKEQKEAGELPASDVLMEDPVCKSLVPMQQAITLQHDGSTYYFCSEKCRDAFIDQQGEKR